MAAVGIRWANICVKSARLCLIGDCSWVFLVVQAMYGHNLPR